MRSQPEMIYSIVPKPAQQLESYELEARLSQMFTQRIGLH